METYDYISIAIAAYFIVLGLASFFTGKVYGMGRSASKYTDESLKKYSRPFGLSYMVSGVGLMLFHILNNELFKIGTFSVSAGLAAMVVLVLVGLAIALAGKKVLVKK